MRWVVLFAGIACLAACWFLAKPRLTPAIAVSVRNDSGGGTDYLPAVDGFSPRGTGHSEQSNGAEIVSRISARYKVEASSPGHFFILAHYVIESRGTAREVDCALPVAQKIPAGNNWTQVGDGIRVCAYMSSNSLYY